MPAVLKRDDDLLKLSIGGMPGPEFRDCLAKVKSIAGKRWDPEEKVWVFPADIDVAIKIVQMIQPQLSAEVQSWVRGAQARIAGDLVTKLPDGETADLTYRFADTLYDYQKAGVAFLQAHPHSILADDMGLGKTVQSLATIEEYAARNEVSGPSLIVCPNSMKGTWAREIERWAYGAEYVVVDGKKPEKRKEQLATPAEFYITNWEKLRVKGMEGLAKRDWLAVIADEAHRAKNRKSQQTKALFKIKAPVQLALTGTPIMNSPDELWALLRWLYPEQYTSYWTFYYQYVDDYEVTMGDRRTRVVTGVKNPDALRFELADKLVRRTKTDVLDLPPKIYKPLEVDLKPEQQKLYDEAEKAVVMEIKQAVDAAEDPETAAKLRGLAREAIEADDPAALQKLMLTIPNGVVRVTRLRQIASSPALLGGEDVSAKYDAVEDLISDNPGQQYVVFCWFKEAATLIADRLQRKLKLRAAAMNGDTSPDDRDDLVRRFQDANLDVLVCTISTGGVGLTLTAAETAIFVERDWTPANNMQAEDRLHRIGQENTVTIVNIEASGTVDTGRVGPKNRLKELIISQVLGD